MASEVGRIIVPSGKQLERAKRKAVIDLIGGKVVFEGSRRHDADLVRSIYGVFLEVGLYLGVVFEEIRKKERE